MNENEFENADSLNSEQDGELDTLEPSALKDLLLKERTEKGKLSETNKQLFERAKKAEGFEKQEDGSWVKIEKAPAKPKKEEKPDEFGLVEKTFLRVAGVTEEDEIELAKDIQKKTGLDWDKLVDDDYFKNKLEGLRTKKANELATSGVKGGAGSSEAKNSPEYWLAKGNPPTIEQVPDRKVRATIARAFMASTKSGKKFYND